MQGPLGAEGVDPAAGDGGSGARSFVESEIVTVAGGVVELPDRAASLCVQRFDHFLVPDAMEQDQAALRDHRSAESLADVPFPNHRRAGRGPFRGQIATRVDAVTRGYQELGPVLRGGAGGHQSEHYDSDEQRNSRLQYKFRRAFTFTWPTAPSSASFSPWPIPALHWTAKCPAHPPYLRYSIR